MENKKRVFVDMDGVLCEYRSEATLDDMEQKGYSDCRSILGNS